MAKKKKIRVALRKNRQNTPRQRGQRAREIDADRDPDNLSADERLSRKGAITRYRTIISSDERDAAPLRDIDQSACLVGRVLSPRGGEYLVDLVELQPLIGTYSQLGFDVVAASSVTGQGISRLKFLLTGRETALAGQSGVGKSSLINALEPGLNLKVVEVTAETRKGKHTTTAARLLRRSFGGWVVDTPAIRPMELGA